MNQKHSLHVDEHFWQRLVDGDLSLSETQRLLAACQAEPELWKQCAMAFLEEQALKQGLEQALDRASSEPGFEWYDSRAIRAHESQAADRLPAALNAVATTSTEWSTPARSRTLPVSSWINWLSLSALVLLAFGIGWQASRRINGSVNSSVDMPNSISSGHSVSSDRIVGSAAHAPPAAAPASGLRRDDAQFISHSDPSYSNTIYSDDRLPSELSQLSNLEVGRSYGVVPVTLNGVPALVPLERLDIRARSSY